MTLPTGFRTPGGFVCWNCRSADDRQQGIGNRLDARMASGEVCVRCGNRMPDLAKVRLLPDGAYSRASIKVERETEVLIDGHALLYLHIGCGPELGLEMTPTGKVKVWVHLDPDGVSPAAEWEFDPELLEGDRG